MKAFLILSVNALGFALLAGCGTGVAPSQQSASPSGDDGANARRCAAPWIAGGKPFECRTNRSKSWMKRSAGTLLYISDIGAETVDVFSYPAGNLVGTLTGFNEPNGLCADAKGNVFVTDTYNYQVVEYAHGGTTPIATLSTPGQTPIGCAIDPKSGDLAVTFYTFVSQGTFSVYKRAKGNGVSYSGLYRTFYCTYDGSGNLFIDGFGGQGGAAIGELAKGASKMVPIGISSRVGWPGGIAWDGKHLALGDQFANKFYPSRSYVNAVYQLTYSYGFNIDKIAPLQGAGDVVQFWLGGIIIGPDAQAEDVAYYGYPKGGNPKKTITGFYEPVGAALSK